MTDADDDALRIYTSKWKMGGLAVPCLVVAYAGLEGLVAGGGFSRSAVVDGMLLLIGTACAGVLLWMAFERSPVLVIDRHGITCRRAPTGLIPWSAIAGLGLGKVSIMRRVLLIAIDAPSAGTLAEKIKRYKASSLLSPTVARFQGQMKRDATIQVPISLLAVSGEELQRMLEERVHYAG